MRKMIHSALTQPLDSWLRNRSEMIAMMIQIRMIRAKIQSVSSIQFQKAVHRLLLSFQRPDAACLAVTLEQLHLLELTQIGVNVSARRARAPSAVRRPLPPARGRESAPAVWT